MSWSYSRFQGFSDNFWPTHDDGLVRAPVSRLVNLKPRLALGLLFVVGGKGAVILRTMGYIFSLILALALLSCQNSSGPKTSQRTFVTTEDPKPRPSEAAIEAGGTVLTPTKYIPKPTVLAPNGNRPRLSPDSKPEDPEDSRTTVPTALSPPEDLILSIVNPVIMPPRGFELDVFVTLKTTRSSDRIHLSGRVAPNGQFREILTGVLEDTSITSQKLHRIRAVAMCLDEKCDHIIVTIYYLINGVLKQKQFQRVLPVANPLPAPPRPSARPPTLEDDIDEGSPNEDDPDDAMVGRPGEYVTGEPDKGFIESLEDQGTGLPLPPPPPIPPAPPQPATPPRPPVVPPAQPPATAPGVVIVPPTPPSPPASEDPPIPLPPEYVPPPPPPKPSERVEPALPLPPPIPPGAPSVPLAPQALPPPPPAPPRPQAPAPPPPVLGVEPPAAPVNPAVPPVLPPRTQQQPQAPRLPAPPAAPRPLVRPSDIAPDQMLERLLGFKLNFTSGGFSRFFYSYDKEFRRYGMITDNSVLPMSGIGFTKLQPNLNRGYGAGFTIQLLEDMARKILELYPSNNLLVNDISERGGGPRGGDTVGSHQNGLDVDIAYLNERPKFAPVIDRNNQMDSDFDFKRNFDFLKTAVQTRMVEVVFMDKNIKQAFCSWAKRNIPNLSPIDKEVLDRIYPYGGHRNHFHLRLKCPKTYLTCRDQSDGLLGKHPCSGT